MRADQVAIGVDGGGTTTRALCVGPDGRALAMAEAGGSNPSHNADTEGNVQQAIRQALARSGRAPADVAALVAGLAGMNGAEDAAWAERCTALPGLGCPRVQLNDAEVAHAGAFRSGPGVIAVSGTGSTIFAVTDTGRRVTNDAFHHYAAAARHLAFDAMHRLLAGDAGPDDDALVRRVLAHWQAPDIAALREHVAGMAGRDYNAEKRVYGGMARIVTECALAGAPLAQAACESVAHALAMGVRLLGQLFAGEAVGVALIGGVARSAFVSARVARLLAERPEKRYRLIDPALSPAAGAALLALELAGATIDDAVVGRLALGYGP